MITAYGTAVVAKNLKSQTVINTGKEIDITSVKDRTRLIRLISQINDSQIKVSFDDLELIVESKMPIFKEYILFRIKYVVSEQSRLDSPDGKKAMDLYSKYFALVENEDVVKSIYDTVLAESSFKIIDALVSIISANDLVDYKEIEKLIMLGSLDVKKQALKLLVADKPYYSLSDVDSINSVVKVISNAFHRIGELSSKKGFLSSNEKEIWICKCGKNNDMDNAYCFNCNNDIYGFKSEEIKPDVIMDFLQRKAIAIGELINR